MVNVCHCSECQRQSGSAFGMSMMVPQANLVVEGTLKSFTRSSASGRPLSCHFCPECGTRIYHVPSYAHGVLNVKPGTLDDPSWLRPGTHFWTSSRQPWVTLPDGVAHHERQP
jgi:hypothetical protein